MDIDHVLKDLYLYSRTGKVDKLEDCIRQIGGNADFGNVMGSALHAAASRGRLDALKLLLAHGADVNAVEGWGASPLIAAAKSGCTECVTSLLKAGANPDHRDMNGRTALDYSASGSPGLRSILIQVTKDPWANADLEKLRGIDPSLAAQVLGFVKAAIAAGRSGEVQNLPVESPLPEWYRGMLASIPLAGTAATLEWGGDDYSHQCVFLRGVDLASIEKEEPWDATAFRAQGVWPVALGTNACYWAIEIGGTPKSPVFFWDHSDVSKVKAFRSFNAFLRALKF